MTICEVCETATDDTDGWSWTWDDGTQTDRMWFCPACAS